MGPEEYEKPEFYVQDPQTGEWHKISSISGNEIMFAHADFGKDDSIIQEVFSCSVQLNDKDTQELWKMFDELQALALLHSCGLTKEVKNV